MMVYEFNDKHYVYSLKYEYEYRAYPPYFYLRKSAPHKSLGYKIKCFIKSLDCFQFEVSGKCQASKTCWSWLRCVETVLCTTSLAAGLGNLYRLPQSTLTRGGLPFLAAYAIISVLIGFPLLFLEIGLGQLAQEGFTKTWRAVPLFRGVGFIKFLSACLVSVYYPLYVGLFAFYIIWLSIGPALFTECASVKITESGYKPEGTPGQQCIKETFLESPYSNPSWYGMYIGILLFLWIIIILFLIKRTKMYVKSLVLLVFPIVGCIIALIVKHYDSIQGVKRLVDEADWTLLADSNIWYFALIQVFFSTNIGFGPFVTNAGLVFSKSSAFWTSFGYMCINLIFGAFSVILCYTISGDINPTNRTGDIAELHLVTLIYDIGKSSLAEEDKVWTIIAYCLFLFSGLIGMITFVYMILKAIRVETRQKWPWWQTTTTVSCLGCLGGAAVLLLENFQLVHIFDYYIVGNLVLMSTMLEVFAIVVFYGSNRIQLDFEFVLGKKLSKAWIILWWCIPLVLGGIFVWWLVTSSGTWMEDPLWVYALGWGVVVTAFVFILSMMCFQICKQDEYYNLGDKLKAAAKPLRKWGPVDPIMRYNWVQWHSKAKDGERDFTLKRRGTKDYTHSVKKHRQPYGRKNTLTISNNSSFSRSSPQSNDHNQNSIRDEVTENYRRKYPIDYGDKPLRVTSLVDSFDSPIYAQFDDNQRNSYPSMGRKTNLNPLSRTYPDRHNDSSPSEGYGTFRKGPYVISDNNVGHVCHRKYSENEISTEL